MTAAFSIFVNTTDSFEDCWMPFFRLFRSYWPEFDGKIYLNTESKTFNMNGLNIISVRNAPNSLGKKKTWSQCLFDGMRAVEDGIFLYMQDDYFLNGRVNSEEINRIYCLMIDANISCVHLTPFASDGPFHASRFKNLLRYDRKANYKISTQASFWRKSLLAKYLRSHENAWQFELYGTKRAWKNEEVH